MHQLTHLSRSQLDEMYGLQGTQGYLKKRREQIEGDLRVLGAVAYDLWLPETHSLPLVLRPDEKITGIVYGRYKQDGAVIGRGALVATDQRVFLLDKKPLFVKCYEIHYGVISAVTYAKVGIIGTVVLHTRTHTRTGDISIRTFNQGCAHGFINAIRDIINQNQATL